MGHEPRCAIERINKHVEVQSNGKGTTSTHGSLQVPVALEGRKTISQFFSEHEIHPNIIRAWRQ